MKYIVTHPGSAHRDDLLACALLLAHYPELSDIYRHEPTPEELEDPEVIIVDVGGRHEPEKRNFDHHQLPREAPPTCALTLILKHLDLYETALDAWLWLKDTEELDSRGPFAWAKKHLSVCSNTLAARDHYSLPWDRVAGIASSPVEGWLLSEFGLCKELRPTYKVERHENWVGSLHDVLRFIGGYLLQQLTNFAKRMKSLDVEAKSVQIVLKTDLTEASLLPDGSLAIGGKVLDAISYVDATCVPRDQNPTFALEAWCKKHAPQAAVTITNDDRGDGLCLFRRNDDPRIDFSRCEGMTGVVFAHKGGFVCKLATGADPLPVLRQAYIGYGDEAALRG